MWRAIARQALPFIHPSAKDESRKQSRAALLLTGPERSGKAMEVLAAGRAVGMHVREVDCRSLASSMMDEAECVAQLLLAFQHVRPTLSSCVCLALCSNPLVNPSHE